jgi:hypothetical protein
MGLERLKMEIELKNEREMVVERVKNVEGRR